MMPSINTPPICSTAALLKGDKMLADIKPGADAMKKITNGTALFDWTRLYLLWKGTPTHPIKGLKYFLLQLKANVMETNCWLVRVHAHFGTPLTL